MSKAPQTGSTEPTDEELEHMTDPTRQQTTPAAETKQEEKQVEKTPIKLDVIKRTSMIREDRVQLVEFARRSFQIIPPPSDKVEDLLRLDYWAHVSRGFKPFDRIEAIAEDGTWYADILILAVGRAWAKVSIIHYKELEKVRPEHLESEYEISWGSPVTKWRVIRRQDRQVLKDNLDSQQTASNWLTDHLRALSA